MLNEYRQEPQSRPCVSEIESRSEAASAARNLLRRLTRICCAPLHHHSTKCPTPLPLFGGQLRTPLLNLWIRLNGRPSLCCQCQPSLFPTNIPHTLHQRTTLLRFHGFKPFPQMRRQWATLRWKPKSRSPRRTLFHLLSNALRKSLSPNVRR
jgi:hypothetical protein